MIEKPTCFRLRPVSLMSTMLLAFAALLTILLFAGGCERAARTPGIDDGWGSVLDERAVAAASAPSELSHVEEKSSPLPARLAGSRCSDPYAGPARVGKSVPKVRVANGSSVLSRAPPSRRRDG